jgi:hypothetical protein
VCRQAIDAHDFSEAAMARYGDLCRSQLAGLRRRGRWLKVADRLVEPGRTLPFWVEFVVKNLVGLDGAHPHLREVGRRVTAGAPR